MRRNKDFGFHHSQSISISLDEHTLSIQSKKAKVSPQNNKQNRGKSNANCIFGWGREQPKKYSNKKLVRYHFDFGFDLCWFLLEENLCLVWCFGVCFGVLVFVCGFYCFSSGWFGVLFGFVGVFLWGFLVSWWVVGFFFWVFFLFACLFSMV